ncbi:MAG TPA: hypothetical protein ENI44_04815 [Thermoplasmatales archaeon]|nr:hypothetical protein [Thermoplasmatales archaeon]
MKLQLETPSMSRSIHNNRKLVCPKCGGELIPLKESKKIYICKNCGRSLEEGHLLVKNDSNGGLLIEKLFNQQFMRKYTGFKSLEEFLRNSNLIEDHNEITYETIENLPKRIFNRYIRSETKFRSWDEMFEKAIELYLGI